MWETIDVKNSREHLLTSIRAFASYGIRVCAHQHGKGRLQKECLCEYVPISLDNLLTLVRNNLPVIISVIIVS